MRTVKKNILMIMILAVVLILGIDNEVYAYDEIFAYGDFEYYFNWDDNYVCISAYNGNESEVVVPSEIDGVKVKYIEGFTSENDTITKIVLPKGLRSVKGFEGCTKLTSINIPESVKEVGPGAFSGCTSLSEIKLPDKLKKLGNFAFQDCTSLKEIVIPERVKEIDSQVFENCTSLEKVTLPKNLEYIGYYCFSGCSGLKTIKLPVTLTGFGYSAFGDCGLTEITIPKNVGHFGEHAFDGCKDLKKVVIKGNKIYGMGGAAFCGLHKDVVFDVPQKSIAKYRKMLKKSSGIPKNKVK